MRPRQDEEGPDALGPAAALRARIRAGVARARAAGERLGHRRTTRAVPAYARHGVRPGLLSIGRALVADCPTPART